MAFPDGVRYIVTEGYPWLEFFDDENPNENGAPFMRQDVHPDGYEWSSITEVTTYAEECMQEWIEAAQNAAIEENLDTSAK